MEGFREAALVLRAAPSLSAEAAYSMSNCRTSSVVFLPCCVNCRRKNSLRRECGQQGAQTTGPAIFIAGSFTNVCSMLAERQNTIRGEGWDIVRRWPMTEEAAPQRWAPERTLLPALPMLDSLSHTSGSACRAGWTLVLQ